MNKKLRGRYEIIAIDWNDNQNIYTIPFYDRKTKESFYKLPLYYVDATLLSYPSKREFLKTLVEKNILPHEMFSLKIRYVHNKEYRYLSLLEYNHVNAYIASLALKKDSDQVDVTIPEVTAFSSVILNYMKDPNLKETLEHDNHIPYHIRTSVARYQELNQKNFLSPEESNELKQIKETVLKVLRRYKDFRGLRIFDEQYRKGKIKVRKQREVIPSEKYQGSVMQDKEEEYTEEYQYLSPEEILQMSGGDPDAVPKYFPQTEREEESWRTTSKHI